MELGFFDVRKGSFTPEVILSDLTVVFCLNLFVHVNWTVAVWTLEILCPRFIISFQIAENLQFHGSVSSQMKKGLMS